MQVAFLSNQLRFAISQKPRVKREPVSHQAKHDAFSRQCEDAYHYMATLIERVDKGEKLQSDELLAHVNSVVEELSVTGEELAQQAEELTVARDELAAQRQYYLDLFELAPDGYLVTDKQGKICESNLAGTTMLSVSIKYLLGKPLMVYVSSSDRKEFGRRLAALSDGRSERLETWEMAIQPRDREAFPALVTAKSCVDNNGEVQQVRWLIHDISARKHLEQQRQWLLERLVTAHEDERATIARDLHDKMAQHLITLVFGLQSLKGVGADPQQLSKDVQRLTQIAEDIGAEVHHIAKELRPAALDDLGLSPALCNFVQEWSEQAGIPVSIHSSAFAKNEPQPPSTVTIAVYRIVQQALANVRKHAVATHVSVVLDKRPGELQVIIEDNGRGFDADEAMRQSSNKNSLGLIGMRERASLLGGTFDIESRVGGGTTVFLRIPV